MSYEQSANAASSSSDSLPKEVESRVRLVQQEVSDFAAKGKKRLQTAQHRANDTVDGATTAVGKQISSLGDVTLKSAKRAGFSLRRVGRYLERTKPSDMAKDMVTWAQEHPRATASIALGGFLLMRRAFSTR